MNNISSRSLASVKFTAVGRAVTFILPDLPFDPPLSSGESVVVRDGSTLSYGLTATAIPEIAVRKAPADSMRQVVRRATKEDVVARLKHERREREAHRVCLLKIQERNLPMKLVKTEHLFDGSRLIVYFTAEGRVDFREFVRELAAEFRIRIEMRQIGARDEAKMLGGYGTCGRPLCCTTWLQGPQQISIKMAKAQNLSLNPSRLSGLCGRLKCCLRYELPNAKGEQYAGCANESACSTKKSAGGCGGGCGSGGCGTGECSCRT